LLAKYAWYVQNAQEKTRPVGTLKPNDLGLFDAQGNVFAWCQESYQVYPLAEGDRVFEDKEDVLSINNTAGRVSRGGAFNSRASSVRSAQRNSVAPALRVSNGGFRPARTLSLNKSTALQDSPEEGRK
jgi:formylglycine-generating enzyme required for sulfatase activity